jgi:hypothetical protein
MFVLNQSLISLLRVSMWFPERARIDSILRFPALSPTPIATVAADMPDGARLIRVFSIPFCEFRHVVAQRQAPGLAAVET